MNLQNIPHAQKNKADKIFLGGDIILVDDKNPEAKAVALVLQDITVHKATLFDGVPTMYMFMLNSPAFAEADLSSLKRCYVGGQTMPVATMEAVENGFGVPLYELWGMTEIAGLGSTHPLYGKNKHGSIGCAIPYCELRIADVDDASKTTPGLLDY